MRLATHSLLVLLLSAANVAADERDFQTRPFQQGVSCGPTPSLPFRVAGTCGARVTSIFAPNLPLILSNSHVFTAIGPNLCPGTAPVGTWILQPGTLDIGVDPGKDVAYLGGVLVGSIPINFSPGASNRVDGALAATADTLSAKEILNIGLPLEQFDDPIPGMAVMKNGRTTGFTTGTVTAINVTSTVNYGSACGSARFVDQVSISPGSFSAGGDSGSVILNAATRAPVALLFAGSPVNTLANRIYHVYMQMGVFIDGEVPAGAAQDAVEAQAQRSQASTNPEIARLRALQARYEPALFRNPDVTAVGIGLGDGGEGFALLVYTRAGASARAAAALPATIEGSKVRLVESGEFSAR